MPCITIKKTLKNRNLWAKTQYIGLLTSGVPAIIRPTTYGNYKFSEQVDGVPFTGPVELIVGQGGLRNKMSPVWAKELFKKDVMPALAKSSKGISIDFTGKIALHFRSGMLQTINLTTN